jgi:hypothetical protein
MNRRRFIGVIAAGGAAALSTMASPSAVDAAKAASAPAPRGPGAKGGPRPAAVQRELKQQEKSVAGMVKVIRDFDLPPGSDLAVTFRPLRARREGR